MADCANETPWSAEPAGRRSARRRVIRAPTAAASSATCATCAACCAAPIAAQRAGVTPAKAPAPARERHERRPRPRSGSRSVTRPTTRAPPGLTVVRGVDRAFRCAAAVVGRATGTRELHAASPFHLVDRVDAVMLDRRLGLRARRDRRRDALDGGARPRAFRSAAGVVPIIPAAVIFDLVPLGSFAARPTRPWRTRRATPRVDAASRKAASAPAPARRSGRPAGLPAR